MTCQQFRQIREQCRTSGQLPTTAEISAMIKHSRECEPCHDIATSGAIGILDEPLETQVAYIAKAAGMLNKVKADPETCQ